MNFNPNLFLFTVAIALCALHTTDAQEVRFSSGIQFGTYAMKDLLEYQSHLADPEFLNAKETESFSPSFGYQGSFVYVGRKRLRGGVEFAHFRSEGKVVGENAEVIYFQHRAMTSTIGGTLSFLLNKKEQPWEIVLSVSTGGSFNKFRRRFPDLEKARRRTVTMPEVYTRRVARLSRANSNTGLPTPAYNTSTTSGGGSSALNLPIQPFVIPKATNSALTGAACVYQLESERDSVTRNEERSSRLLACDEGPDSWCDRDFDSLKRS